MTVRSHVLALVLLACLMAGCAGRYDGMVDVSPADLACRTPAAGEPHVSLSIDWRAPLVADERRMLDAWCGTTGPPVIDPLPALASHPSGDLVVVSWNLHVGAADLPELVRRLRAGDLTGGTPVSRFVLLLQEAHRAGADVPETVRARRAVPRAIQSTRPGHEREDIVSTARSLGLALYYVPSMRNGPPTRTNEDRGNAILSTEPLSAFSAVELPFERQRRVAIAAIVSGRRPDGGSWQMRVVSAHLDTLASARRLWLSGPRTRARQARGLLDALQAEAPADALVLGSDLNTWLGFWEPAYRLIAGAIPDAVPDDRRPTFGRQLRLDHLFARLPGAATVAAGRVDDRFGSDHHPLFVHIHMP